MKTFAILSSVTAANAISLATLIAGQMPNNPLAGLVTPEVFVHTNKMPAKVINMTSQINPKAIRQKLIYGPFKVKAANASHALDVVTFKLDPTSDLLLLTPEGMCEKCMVLYAQGDVVNEKGSKVDVSHGGVYSHHILATDWGRKMVIPPISSRCADGSAGGFNFEIVGMGAAGMGHRDMGMPGDKAMNMNKPPAAGAPAAGAPAPAPAAPAAHMKRQSDSQAQPDLGKIIGGMIGDLGKNIPPEILGSLAEKFMPAMSIFLAQGDEMSGNAFHGMGKIKAGFYKGTEDRINLMAEVVNYQNTPTDVYVSIEYEYLPEIEDKNEYYDVGQGAINVSPCGSSDLRPPTDKPERYVSPPWKVLADGYLLDVKPHLHDGGINATFFVNGKLACTSHAVYAGDGGFSLDGKPWETITAYSPCADPVKIMKGDNLTMEAWYDLTSHRLRPTSTDHNEGAEGMALAIFEYARPPLKK